MTPMLTTPLPILYEDDDLVVVSKPAGMLVHRDAFTPKRESVLLQTLSGQIGRFLYPVHRLDRNTSGIIAFGLSSEMAKEMHANLADDAAEKKYLVLVRGTTPEVFASDRPLTSRNGEKRPARTSFRRLGTFSRCSLLEATLHTGRFHQIRRHLAHLAHQVIGDSSHGKGRINGFFRTEYGLPRMFVHARRLHAAHPRTGEPLDIADPLPDDLRTFLRALPDVDGALLDSL